MEILTSILTDTLLIGLNLDSYYKCLVIMLVIVIYLLLLIYASWLLFSVIIENNLKTCHNGDVLTIPLRLFNGHLGHIRKGVSTTRVAI